MSDEELRQWEGETEALDQQAGFFVFFILNELFCKSGSVIDRATGVLDVQNVEGKI